jgi:hypothetical protein
MAIWCSHVSNYEEYLFLKRDAVYSDVYRRPEGECGVHSAVRRVQQEWKNGSNVGGGRERALSKGRGLGTAMEESKVLEYTVF